MSIEKNTQQQSSTQDNPAKKTARVDNKSSIGGVFAKITLAVSIAALGLSSYALVNSISQTRNSNTNFQT
ncbi:hypothetical protein FWI75_06125, partial [Francisella tularensis subsp. holarctica]|nr:hypothetical protein [Francisella tularensis subsp. holarctica]